MGAITAARNGLSVVQMCTTTLSLCIVSRGNRGHDSLPKEGRAAGETLTAHGTERGLGQVWLEPERLASLRATTGLIKEQTDLTKQSLPSFLNTMCI